MIKVKCNKRTSNGLFIFGSFVVSTEHGISSNTYYVVNGLYKLSVVTWYVDEVFPGAPIVHTRFSGVEVGVGTLPHVIADTVYYRSYHIPAHNTGHSWVSYIGRGTSDSKRPGFPAPWIPGAGEVFYPRPRPRQILSFGRGLLIKKWLVNMKFSV